MNSSGGRGFLELDGMARGVAACSAFPKYILYGYMEPLGLRSWKRGQPFGVWGLGFGLGVRV